MRAPKVRNAKQRGKQYNSNLAQGSPMHYAIAGACAFTSTGEKNVWYFALGYPAIIFVLLK